MITQTVVTEIFQYPPQRSAEARVGFWLLSNPARPEIVPVRVTHGEDWQNVRILSPSTFAERAKVEIFIPERVAAYLAFDIAAAPRRHVLAPNGASVEVAELGLVRMQSIRTLEEENIRKECPDYYPPAHTYELSAYAWAGQLIIGPTVKINSE